MEVGKLSVEFRSETGKTINRRLRAQKKIPAICYGGGADPLTLALDPALLVKALDPVKKTNTVLALEVKDAPGGVQTLNVMVRDYQRDAVDGDLIHVDFVRVQLDKDVHAVVPIVLTGKCEGVKNGGILHQVIRMLEIACTPDKIPAKIEVDVTSLNMGEAIHVSDLKLAAGIRPLADAGSAICSVTAPRVEKVVEAAPVEVAAPAEGGAAPAAGGERAAAAGDKAAAKAPAAKEGEKKGK